MSADKSFVEAIKSPKLEGKRFGVLRETFRKQKGIDDILDSKPRRLDDQGGKLVDISIPELDYSMTLPSVFSTRSKGDINTFLDSRKEFAHMKIEDIQQDDNYQEALNLIDGIPKALTSSLQSPHFGRRPVEQARFHGVVAGNFARGQLDAIIYPTCPLLAPKTKDVLEMR